MFQQPRIQLSTEEQTRLPPLVKRSSSNWSIPCCSNFSIRGQRIELPDDSDEEEQQQEEFITPFTMNFESANKNTFAQHSSTLSRNPFARVEEQDRPTANNKVVPEEESETVAEELFQQQSGEEDVEELADFSRSVTANKYANEPDWTEMYQDEDESVKDQPLNTQTHTQISDTIVEEEEITPKFESVIESESNIEEESIIESIMEEEPKKEEKIPQIDDKILHYLPLPELSNEIPPTLIHKKPSFERSMYGEQPLMSTYSKPNKNRISRFSMTEEDFLKLKKQEEQEINKKKAQVEVPEAPEVKTEVPSTDSSSNKQAEESVVTQQRRSSIAQSILGDKLDDFTEKLAFIKKNIIMSIDSDDEEEADNAETTLKKIAEMNMATSSTKTVTSGEDGTRRPSLSHRRTSSLMDVAPTIARFMNQISGNNSTEDIHASNTSFSPSALFSALAGPEPSNTSRSLQNKSTEEQQEDEDEELFDFTKVIEIGKNMKSFSEGVVGNGLRIFNDVATRIKTQAEEEERLRQAQHIEEEEEENDHSNWLNDSYI